MTIRCSVTVSLVPEARGGPFIFWDDLGETCRQAGEFGFDGIEIFPPGPEAVDAATLERLLAQNRLVLAAMGTGAGWVRRRLTLTSPDRAVRGQARDFVRSIIDLAGRFRAPAIIGSMQGRWGDGVDRDTALRLLANTLEELGEHARGHSVPLLYEPLNRYETNLFTTLGEAAAFVRSFRIGNVSLLADLFHMNIEEVDLAAALRENAALVGHVHFVDSNRRPAGFGHIDYAPIAAALRASGYVGFVSAEALPYPDSAAAARQTIESFRRYFPRTA